MRVTIRGVVFGGIVAASVCWATPALADSTVLPPAASNPDACVGLSLRYVTQDNDISPYISAQGIGNVAAANGTNGGGVTSFIRNTPGECAGVHGSP